MLDPLAALEADARWLQQYVQYPVDVHLADASNYSASAAHPWGYRVRAGIERAPVEMLVCHTPEEPRDDVMTTPQCFASPGFGASTNAFTSASGRIVLMVPFSMYAWAQGTGPKNTRQPRPGWWRPEMRSYNVVGLSVEVEGYAASSGRWMQPGTLQFEATAALLAAWSDRFSVPATRARIVGHGELSTERTDPGPNWPWPALVSDVRQRVVAKRLTPRAAAGLGSGYRSGRARESTKEPEAR